MKNLQFIKNTVPKTPDPDAAPSQHKEEKKQGVVFEDMNEKAHFEEETIPKPFSEKDAEEKPHSRLLKRNVPKGYFLFVNENSKLCFARSDGSEDEIVVLCQYAGYVADYTWAVMRIRRDNTGNFEFFENGKLIMTCYDVTYKKSDNVHISINNYTNGLEI